MAKTPILDDKTKARIGRMYQQGDVTQEYLADLSGCSARTVRRVLQAQGILEPRQHCTKEEARLAQIARRYKMTPKKLEKVLAKTQGGPSRAAQ